ncbi:PCYCGC motif-containing (lipo)protein [Paenibacillus lautus]|uniref:PCYCGC motif-containing (lipo)protein n=1 Tax=Paenibacillus TaxID=44249 RepID=UPI000C275A8B|nr:MULTISPECIES: PCYCGC motif-containing (lipo)protein [Paenibacillus]MEC0309330.1 PCYCGC motif-containing (lipo)protein [Paenibacillus lautus]
MNRTRIWRWRMALTIFLILLAAGGFMLFKTSPLGKQGTGDTQVSSIAIFALKGCGGCSKALGVMEQMEAASQAYRYQYFSISEDTEAVNRYGITEHPTILFLNAQDEELGRLTEDISSDKILRELEDLAANGARPPKGTILSAIPSTMPSVTLHAYDPHSGLFTPVSQYVQTDSSVRYPKVSAMSMLTQLGDLLPPELESAIPDGVTFVEIRTEHGVTVVELSPSFRAFTDSEEGNRAEQAIALTLQTFEGVNGVQVVSGAYSSDILYAENLAGRSDGKSDYLLNSDAPLPHMSSVKEYNAAILHASHLAFMPCFCGCGDAGHSSNLNCYYAQEDDGRLTPTTHAKFCQTCLDVTNMYLSGRQQGLNMKEIRQSVDQAYQGIEPTNTPMPSN